MLKKSAEACRDQVLAVFQLVKLANTIPLASVFFEFPLLVQLMVHAPVEGQKWLLCGLAVCVVSLVFFQCYFGIRGVRFFPTHKNHAQLWVHVAGG